MSLDERRVVDVVAETIGYTPGIDGLIGSGLSRILAYNKAADIVKALGLPLDLPAETLRRWATYPDRQGPTEPPTGECDWGWCDDEATCWRWWPDRERWLPVCDAHAVEGEGDNLAEFERARAASIFRGTAAARDVLAEINREPRP